MKRSTFITTEQLKVGGVILVALLILIVTGYKLGQAANLFTSRYELVTFLPDGFGLREGGQVQVAGQQAGNIKRIDFLPVDGDTTRNLRVTLEIDEALRSQVRADSRGEVRTLGLLGDKFLNIRPGTVRYGVLQDGDTLSMGESLDYDAIIRQASGAVEDMVQLTRDLRTITGGIVRGEGTMGQLLTNRTMYDELTTTLTSTNRLLTRLQNPNGTVGRLLEDPQLYQNLNGMLVSVDTLVRAMTSSQGTVGLLLRDTTLYTQLRGVVTSADSITRNLAAGKGTAGRMLTDQQMYDQLTKTLTDLNAILEDVRRNPRKYTRGLVKVF
jgi:phospholipid/cholesterol/gamma-HCH transport system substrate-binding protein